MPSLTSCKYIHLLDLSTQQTAPDANSQGHQNLGHKILLCPTFNSKTSVWSAPRLTGSPSPWSLPGLSIVPCPQAKPPLPSPRPQAIKPSRVIARPCSLCSSLPLFMRLELVKSYLLRSDYVSQSSCVGNSLQCNSAWKWGLQRSYPTMRQSAQRRVGPVTRASR